MSNEVQFRSDFDVQLLDFMGGDARIAQAARISNQTIERAVLDSPLPEQANAKLIHFLMEGRHGSPFEHTAMTWRITAPIFVWREFHRHRIASYNEQSSRWMTLEPVFYMPKHDRPVIRRENTRKGDYGYRAVNWSITETQPIADVQTAEAYSEWMQKHRVRCTGAYRDYVDAVEGGVAGEVARMILPVSIYSTCYVTMNVRGLMNFLSLRTDETAQEEIRRVARMMEADFRRGFPETHNAWCNLGKIAP